MTPGQRARGQRKAARQEREPARLAARRDARRRSEKLRRMLGKSPSAEQRRAAYARDPEPFRASERRYRERNRDAISARRPAKATAP